MSVDPKESAERTRGEYHAFGPFRLFPTARRLERNGAPVELGGRALDILIALVGEAGKVVSKTDLMSSIWAGTTVVEGVVRTHVCGLRKALGDGTNGARYITSVAGRGYCFVAPVVRGALESIAPSSGERIQVAGYIRKLEHGLPPCLARIAGRDETVRTICTQLAEHRFVTILGAAGIGKTTVAVSVGHALLANFAGEVHFVELGSVTDPGLLVATVASAIGLPVQADEALPSLQAFLQDKRVLLVLDNCEHLVDEAARLAEYLFVNATHVHLLATSREALRVEGERVYRLGPLETPAEYAGMSAETVQTFPAVQVFLERAAASGWFGELTDGDVPVVAETCKRLDGVALALELAASFVGECGLKGTAAMLDDRLRLLWQHGRRTAPPRQQTLHALISWSYDRLLERERTVLRRLSVFVDAFPIDAAMAVVVDAGECGEAVLDVMNELVGKSLLSSAVTDGSVVYRMLETTRVYALARLAESGELEQVSLRHASFFSERLGHVGAGTGPSPARRQASDLANVRAALHWCFASPLGHEAGVRLAATAARMLLDLGLVRECHDRCRQALDVIGECDAGTVVELRLQEAFAVSAMSWSGYGDDVRIALSRGLELARALGGGDHEVRLLEHLNLFLLRIGDLRGALLVAEQSIAAAHVAGTASTISAQWMLSRTHEMCGNHALAQEHCEAGLRLAAASGEAPTKFAGHTPAILALARALWLRGQADRALTLARQIIDEAAMLTHPVDKCLRLIHCEPIFVWRGEWDDADRLLDVLAEHVDRYSLASFRGIALALRGELLVKTHRSREGCGLLRTADSLLKAARSHSHATYVVGALAEGLAATGALDEALAAIESSCAEAEDRGGTWNLPELLRIKGGLLASRSPTDTRAVDEALSSAIALAQRHGALAWELRATTALTRERLRRGKPAGDLETLSALYGKFTEGMETPDLQAARHLLGQRVVH